MAERWRYLRSKSYGAALPDPKPYGKGEDSRARLAIYVEREERPPNDTTPTGDSLPGPGPVLTRALERGPNELSRWPGTGTRLGNVRNLAEARRRMRKRLLRTLS